MVPGAPNNATGKSGKITAIKVITI